MGLVICATVALPALAAQQAPLQLPSASIEDEGQERYKPDVLESPKATQPLLDTPQTITVISEAVIKDQNLFSLRDVLSTVPGITFGAGEGGGGYGDSVNLRGFSANSDMLIDGVRDSAQYTRSDPFNLEQIEVVNGANSVFSGAGSVGGTINIISKRPKDQNFTTLSGGVGTDDFFRGTVDANHVVNDSVAVRVNLMGHMNDIPGRKVEDAKRWGIAPSVTVGLGGDTQATFLFIHQHDNNVPQYGVPYYMNAFNAGSVPGADRSNYYGYANMDVQRSNLDAGTVIIDHRFDDTFSLRNLTRYQQVTQYALVNPPQGTWCLAGGISATGTACAFPGFYAPSGPRGTTRSTKNTNFYNQTDLIANYMTGDIRQTTVFGIGIANESFYLNNGNTQRTAAGATPTYPNMNIANPDPTYTGPVNYIQGGGGAAGGAGSQDGSLRNQAMYLFQTAEFNEHFEANGGIRYEHNDGSHTTGTYSPTGAFASQGEVFRSEDWLFSYRFGLVYKPIADASIYVAYGNSQAPSKTSVNGSCTAATCAVAPEKAKNYEIGAKWNLLENRLSLTGSLFRNARTNFRVASNDPLVPEQQLDGSARVDGVTLGAAGTITPEWMVFTNYSYLKSKIIRSLSQFCIANPSATCGNTVALRDPQAGNQLANVPGHAFSFWTTYALPFNVTLGYGANYSGSWYLNTTAPLFKTKAYITQRAMVSYAFNDQLDLQLNVNNLFDTKYYSRVRNNGWATPGDRRQVTLTANYAF